MKLKTFILISSVLLGVFAFLTMKSCQAPPVSAQAALGKEIWQRNNCISCHTILGNGGYMGEDLTHIVKKLPPEAFVDFFTHPPVMPPNRHRLHPALTKGEATALFEYFDYLNNIDTLGWPPHPIKESNHDD